MKILNKLILLFILFLLPIEIDAYTENNYLDYIPTISKESYYKDVELDKKVYDYALILNDQEEQEMQTIIEKIINKYHIDIVVMTTDHKNNESVRSIAEYFYDTNGFGKGASGDGIILVIDMYQREYYILTTGSVVDTINNFRVEMILDKIENNMINGNYEKAVNTFIQQTEKYHFYHKYGPPYLWIIAIIIAIILAYLTLKHEKKKLKLITDSLDASNYYEDQEIDYKDESLIDTTKRVIYRNTSNGSSRRSSGSRSRSSGGRRHGGGGRRF